MALRDEFAGIIQREQPLAPFTHLKIGGPAEYLIAPRSREELARVVATCAAEKIPLRVLGVGTNLLVRDEGVRGAVVRLSAPCFTEIKVDGKRLRAGGGAALSAVIAEAALHGLAGFETLVGITATIGGALRCNAGDRAGEIADHVRSVEVIDERGQIVNRQRTDLHFGDHTSDIEDPVVLAVEFELIKDSLDSIVKQLLKAWIHRKATQPFTFQAAVRMFKNPRGYQASALIEKAGLVKSRSGSAEVSERNGNYIVVHSGADANDVLQLIDQVQKRVRESSGVLLERELTVW
jgi:UDP-N-acetylmuramate dehydrogenase